VHEKRLRVDGVECTIWKRKTVHAPGLEPYVLDAPLRSQGARRCDLARFDVDTHDLAGLDGFGQADRHRARTASSPASPECEYASRVAGRGPGAATPD
jgi:hypothetical protein